MGDQEGEWFVDLPICRCSRGPMSGAFCLVRAVRTVRRRRAECPRCATAAVNPVGLVPQGFMFTVIGAEVVEFPALSVLTAVRVCWPMETFLVFHVNW